jgi:hypothetical protein
MFRERACVGGRRPRRCNGQDWGHRKSVPHSLASRAICHATGSSACADPASSVLKSCGPVADHRFVGHASTTAQAPWPYFARGAAVARRDIVCGG